MNKFINATPCNPNAIEEVKNVLRYLSELSGKGIITGQHTQTTVQKELRYIKDITGKLPALCGFELLAYSPNINYGDAGEACLMEVEENKNTLDNAWDWALNKRGLITFTWHWFSPFGSRDKGFYTENTTFDASRAIIGGTEENKMLIADMDHMAALLKPFCEQRIPVLWRPFHESEGDWFWWGAKGPEVAKQLYRIMYERYTNHHGLNNLIWVWNSPLPEGYVGDDVCDVISLDLYPPKHTHTDLSIEYNELVRITPANKLTALGEIGVVPSLSMLAETRIPWVWYMIWSNDYGASGEWTTNEELRRAYDHPYAVTLDQLPRLY
ncbi:glycosyl hydrolase [Paenibacillus jilunlii]|uniref:Beta-mannosidase n=1 Tax=Paenibacillus jilunlii TaxID=682956 RepID=A0A1G9UQ68_9BACL|nr:glycosyl hydrolase [Paenibacillus jilunlii]KWX72301.1 beta-mannosidase [Paenibacillus jilunlii]SDM62016.1 mannan endo-1,4-beta-mannosidase [Paenibacillus jilunlii]